MLEQETEQIISLLIRDTIGEKEQIRLEEVLAASIPRGIKSYFRAEVVGWLADEIRQGRRMRGIVQETASGTGAAAAMVNAAALEYMFPRAEFVATLDASVHFLGNYLCRPAWTLRQFLTPGGQPASATTVRQRLTYVVDYPHLPRLIARYMESRDLTAITPPQLAALLEQIERLVVQRGTFAALARMTEPLFELFGPASAAGNALPLKALLVFLADKNQPMLQEQLEQTARTRGLTSITHPELVRLFSALDDDARIRSTLNAPPEEPAPDAAEPPADPAPPAPKPPQAPPSPARDSRNIPLSLTFAGMESARNTLPPLEKFIRDEQRRFFVDAIFQKDADAYAGIIEGLNGIPSWNEAAGYLRDMFEKLSVDPLSDEALEFVEAVQLRYRSGTP